MNIVCFPEDLCASTIEGILRGGHDKVREANAMVVGGHTIEDKEPKFGLSVTGFIHPDDVMKNSSAKTGDILVLTKPIGVGVVNTAFKADMAEKQSYEEAILSMRTLNKIAKDAMMKVGANACTDVTGFGLMGHAFEMAEGSGKTLHLHTESIPTIYGALELASMGIIPAGAYANMEHIKDEVLIKDGVAQNMVDCMYDPQTSGGLLISLPAEKKDEILKELEANVTPYAVIGEVTDKQEYYIVVD
jgi:selenide,water dikinase